MPTYEYGCKACGHRFEELQRMSEEPIKVCPSCEKESVERFVSGGAGLIFKGSGFYITDYARKNGSNGNGSKEESSGGKEKSDKSSDSGKSEKTESKSSSKAEKSE